MSLEKEIVYKYEIKMAYFILKEKVRSQKTRSTRCAVLVQISKWHRDKTAQIETAQIETTQIETAQIKTAQIETAQIPTTV